MEDAMNVLSLFDGISCGQVALERMGIQVNQYFASEINERAIAITQKNYPDTVQLGDVRDWKTWDLPKIDLLIGGSPCQGFSSAGKRQGLDDPRSALFWEFVGALRHFQPRHFLLENVVMPSYYQQVISDALGVSPIEINSALVSAQSRRRLYWCNWKSMQPPDIHRVIADVIGGEFPTRDRHDSTLVLHKLGKGGQGMRVYSVWGKAPCLRAGSFVGSRICTPRELIGWYDSDDQLYYRPLSPSEWELLQGLPVDYTEGQPKTHRLHAIGNGWQVDTIAWLFSEMGGQHG
jgi:hypothetical protein